MRQRRQSSNYNQIVVQPSSAARRPHGQHHHQVVTKRQKDSSKPGMNLHKKPLFWLWQTQIWFLTGLVANAQWYYQNNDNHDANTFSPLFIIPVMHLVYGISVIYFGHCHQLFQTPFILESFPIFWLTLFPVIYTQGVALYNWDNVTVHVMDFYPQRVWFSFQAMRTLAFTSLVKYFQGFFPFAFAWFTALPDFLFGLSAAVMALTGMELSMKALAIWNIIGFIIIVPIGAVALQSGMHPTQLYKPKVTHDLVFYWPMVMAPMLVVPMLLSWNILVAMWALDKQ